MNSYCTPLGSISSKFYKQLLPAKTPKAQKDSQVKQLFAVSRSLHVKAACKYVDKIDPRTRIREMLGTGKMGKLQYFLELKLAVLFKHPFRNTSFKPTISEIYQKGLELNEDA